MNSIELSNNDQATFLRYLAYRYKHGQVQQGDVKNYEIIVETKSESYLNPSLGEFHWVEGDDTFLVSYREEGKPLAGGFSFPKYFRRLIVSHTDLEKLKAFVTEALSFKKPHGEDMVEIRHSSPNGYWENTNKGIHVQNIASVYLPKAMKTQILDTIETFLKPSTKERYIRYGRPYKLTYLLMGAPGCGKTSLVKALALHFKMDIYHLCVSKRLTDEALIDLVNSVHSDGILLIEDVDSFFEERKAVETNVSFANLINLLDGTISNCGGLITFLTANHPEKLDKAFIRPGRVDHILKFDYPEKQEVQDVFQDITGKDDFEHFYKHVRNIRAPMSAIIDYLFRHSEDYLESIDELLNHIKLLHEIHNNTLDKLYT